MSGYETSQALDNPNHYTDSENENNGGEIESEPDKLNAQKQVGDYEPSQEQEKPETLDTENDSEQSSGQKPSEEENAQNDMQSGGNGSTSDSASNNSSSKSNEMDNNNSKDNAQDSGAPAVSAADDVPEQSGGMSM